MMRQITKYLALSFIGCVLMGYNVVAQTAISGSVIDAQSNEPLIGVSILVKGKVIGTISDTKGNFSLNVSSAPPFTLVFSMVGYTTVEQEISDSNVSGLQVSLEESAIMGQEVVVSASRVEESVMQSPVSVEKMDVLAIRETAAPNFYEALQNFKGVDLSTQSLTFKSVNIRGFGSNGNVRMVQTIDGIDNVAPGLNFSVGNIVGINDLDLESAELLPGASSALYGPNALNGALLMTSKSPFDYQGLSAYTKLGVNHVDNEDHDAALFQDYGFRYARAFNNKFAFKMTASYLKAEDFIGVDTRDRADTYIDNRTGQYNGAGYVVETEGRGRNENRTYDGVNTYGDFTIGFDQIYEGSIGADGTSPLDAVRTLLPSGPDGLFSPTGYDEADFTDNGTESLKLGGALHYRINDDTEILGQFNWGQGSSVYTANDRFILRDFVIWTGKLEVRGANYYGRAYWTQEDAGDSFAANTMASLMNQQLYLLNYTTGFVGARGQGVDINGSHAAARAYADGLRAQPGTPVFDSLANQLQATSIKEGGARFLDNSSIAHAEGGYNFSDLISWADIQVGANFRRYNLNSKGTLFALDDDGEEQNYIEYGGYLQGIKKVLDDRLKIQASLRYDKNENFEGQLSPRLSLVGTVAQNHNFRGSFQRGFRIPTAQDQFIDLDVAVRRLIGSDRSLVKRYGFQNLESIVYSSESILQAQTANDPTLLQTSDKLSDNLKTEKISSFEVGYRGLYLDNKLMLDGYYYHSFYNDFIGEIYFNQVVNTNQGDDPTVSREEYVRANGFDTPDGFNASSEDGREAIASGNLPAGSEFQQFGFDVNADGTVQSHGWGAEVAYFLNGGYRLSANVSYDDLLDDDDLRDQNFTASFNTPKYKYNVSLGNREVIDNLGFNLVWRWQQAFYWESSYGNAVVPEFGTLDAQVSYKLPDFKSIIKVGGSNVLNKRYTTGFGNPRVGALYYVSITFDEFLN